MADYNLKPIPTDNSKNIIAWSDELVTSLIGAFGSFGSVDENYSTTNGYVRWGNGFQIAWKVENVPFAGQAYGSLFYSDHQFGNWAKPFSLILDLKHTANSLQYWTTTNLVSSSNAGNVRLYRPNNSSGNIEVRAVAIGRWK